MLMIKKTKEKKPLSEINNLTVVDKLEMVPESAVTPIINWMIIVFKINKKIDNDVLETHDNVCALFFFLMLIEYLSRFNFSSKNTL